MHIFFKNWRASKIQAEKIDLHYSSDFWKTNLWVPSILNNMHKFFKLEYDRNIQIHWNFEQRSHIAQEFENVRARKGYALLHWSFWQEFTFFQVSANFLKIGGVKFSTFWTPFKLKWNEKKWFVFEAEAIWCWKKNSIFYVLICLSNETLFIWCDFKKYMNDVELWLPTVATRNDVQYAILTILLVSGTFFPKKYTV